MSRQTVACFEILGESYPIFDGMNIIGRDIEASVIIKNLKISKQHAAISVLEGKHYITDLKSSNGCTLNGASLQPFKFYEIQDHSDIILGDLIGKYHIESHLFERTSKEVQFLKPKVPDSFNFVPTQQIGETPKINITNDDTYMAATQLITNESTNTSKAHKLFSLLERNDEANDSNEIVLCNDSLNDNFDESFAKVPLEESIEVPCTQDCFNKSADDSLNDSTVIPCTQDVSFKGLNTRSIKPSCKATQDSQDCATQINEDDSDATDTEIAHDDLVNDICISIKKLTPEPTENVVATLENKLSEADKTDLSDDEIDFCEIPSNDVSIDKDLNNEKSNISKTISDFNTTKGSSCVNDLDQNINEEDLQNSSVKSKDICENQDDSSKTIPATEDYEFNIEPDKFDEQLDVIPSTQDINEEKTSKSKELIVEDNIDEQYLAPTQILDMSTLENKDKEVEFKHPALKKAKKNIQNESLDEEDDINFLASTQEMLNSTTNEESQSHNLDYHSSQEIDGIPEVTSFDSRDDIFVAPTQVLKDIEKPIEKESSKNQEEIDFSAATQILKDIQKPIEEESTKNQHDVNFSAATQILKDIQQPIEKESTKNQEEVDFSAATQIIKDIQQPIEKESTKNQQEVDFSAATQIIKDIQNTIEEESIKNQQEVDFSAATQILEKDQIVAKNQNYIDVDFSAPTQKLNEIFDKGDNGYFLAPTQSFMPKNQSDVCRKPSNEIISKKNNTALNKDLTIFTSTNHPQLSRAVDDEIFLAPTQELIDRRIDEIKENEIVDSDDSDIIIKKKRPKVIKETQEIVVESDSDSEIGYKHKKPKLIVETQEILSNIAKLHVNDSAVVISELDDTEESIRLVFSNTSMNVSTDSLNATKNDMQLEVDLPTEKEYFVSQNIRPKNPLLQVLSSEDNQNVRETQISPQDVVLGSTPALNLFANLVNQSLEPTQIIVNDLDESIIHIPDSDPEDYDQFCEMETQPIGDIFDNDASKVPKKTRKRRTKQTNGVFIEPEVITTLRTKSALLDPTIIAPNKSLLETNEKEKPTRRKRKLQPKCKVESKAENISTEDQSITTRIRSKHNLKDETTVRTTRGRNKVQTEKEDTPSSPTSIPVKRSTRANSVSKEEPSTSTTKRTKRGKSISSEETEVNVDVKKSRRKTLATVQEDKSNERPKNKNNKGNKTDIEVIAQEKKFKRTTRNNKNKDIRESKRSDVEILEDTDEETDKNIKNTRRKIPPPENEKENNKIPQTRKKIKSDSFSLDESPTKKLKTDETFHDFNPSVASTSSPRRETRLRHKVVFTMLDDTNLEATITRLGGTIVNSSQECTVLVTSKISRSLKFLVAVTLGKPIVGPEWVKACGSKHKFVDPWDYILKDTESEKNFHFRLRDAIIHGQKSKLLEGYTCLLLVSKNLDVLKNVIEASGGICVTRVPPKNTDFIVISYPEDKNKYAKYLKQKPPVRVFGAEAIFSGALLQKLVLQDHVLK